MEWERKFSNIVRETESNLAKVKQRLGSSRSFSTNAASPSASRGGPSAFYPHDSSHSFTVAERDLTSPDLGHTPAGLGHTTAGLNAAQAAEILNGLHVAQSPGVVMLLSDKLDAQTRAIENLSLTVKRLEDEKDSYQKQIKGLKDELSRVDARMVERGVDLQTEQKIERWRRDVAAEMHHLQSALRNQRNAREDEENSSVSQAASFIRDLHDMKRNFQDDMNLVRRDVESMKNRLLRVEADVATFSTDNRDISRRHDRIEQNLVELRERQNLAASLPEMSRRAGAGAELHTPANNEVAELRGSIKLLENKLANIESKAQAASDTNGFGRSNGKFSTGAADLLSSDLDLSDLSSDDLDFDLTTNPTAAAPGKSDSFDYDVDLGLTSEDLISTEVDTEDI